ECRSTPPPLLTLPDRAPDIYADLVRDVGDSAPATIIEIPVVIGQSPDYLDQIYMYYSTFHWQRLINGYSGFFPPSYLRMVADRRGFPDSISLGALRERNARYAVIHGERLEPEVYQRLIRSVDACDCGLTLVARRPWREREISLYRLQ